MTIKWFIQHQIKQSLRSSIWQKNVILNIVIGLLMVIMLAYLLMIGIFIEEILTEVFPDQDPLVVFNGFLLFYFGIEFLMRFFVQSLPVLNLETYLHLPIRKNAIVHYVASKSAFALWNYLSWFILIPFTLKVIAPEYSTGTALLWLLGIVLLVFTNNFLATYAKRQLVSKPAVVGIFGIVLVSLGLLDYFNLISLSTASASFFIKFVEEPLWLLLPALLLILSYLLTFSFLKSRLYPEDINRKKKNRSDGLANIKYLRTMGLTGQLLSLELRLLWRHKRTRTLVLMAPIFLGYGLIFYTQEEYQGMSTFLVFVGIFMTGGMMINYMNYCFSYESNYFDKILTTYTDYKQYIRVKYLLAISVCTISFLLTTPYVLFGTEILLINTATFLYNIGCLTFALYFVATYSRKKMDLSKGSAFNYQGMGASHWLSMLPAFLLPVLMFIPFNLAGIPQAGVIFIGALGLIGLLFHRYMLGVILRQFLKVRHAMAEGFRKN